MKQVGRVLGQQFKVLKCVPNRAYLPGQPEKQEPFVSSIFYPLHDRNCKESYKIIFQN